MTMLSTKDRIFQSALELFASQGIQATSTAQISKKQGLPLERFLFTSSQSKSLLTQYTLASKRMLLLT